MVIVGTADGVPAVGRATKGPGDGSTTVGSGSTPSCWNALNSAAGSDSAVDSQPHSIATIARRPKRIPKPPRCGTARRSHRSPAND